MRFIRKLCSITQATKQHTNKQTKIYSKPFINGTKTKNRMDEDGMFLNIVTCQHTKANQKKNTRSENLRIITCQHASLLSLVNVMLKICVSKIGE